MMRLQRFPAEQPLGVLLAEWGVGVARAASVWREFTWVGRLACVVALLALNSASAQAAPLLQSQEPGRDATSATGDVADTGSRWSSVASGARAELVLRLLGASTSDELGFDSAAMEAALQVDPGEAGLQAVAQTLRDSTTLRQVLGAATALRDDRAGRASHDEAPSNVLVADALSTTDPRSGIAVTLPGTDREPGAAGQRAGGRDRIAAQRRAQQRNQSGETLEDTSLVQDDGPALRTVLRSFVRVRRGDERQRSRSVEQSIADAAMDVADDGLSLGERLLDSRMLGDALQNLITRPTAYQLDSSFSVLGYGRFEMELDLASDLGGVTVSEHTTGVSLWMPLESGASPDPDQRPAQPREKVDLFLVISNFMRSETGVSLMIISGVLLIVLGMLRFAMGLRR